MYRYQKSIVTASTPELVAMVKLGDTVNKVLSDPKARERLGDEFVNMVEDLAPRNTEFMRGLQRDATLRYTMEAATRKPNPTPTLTAAMEKHGAQVRKETEGREQRHKALSDDIAAANAMMNGEEPAAPQKPATPAETKQEPAHPVDELTQDEETRAWGKAIYNKARSDRGRRKALDMVRLAPQLRESGVDVTTEAGSQKAADMAEYAARCREQLGARAQKPLDDETQARVLATLMGWERWHELGELVDEAAAWDGKKRVTPKLIEAPKEGTDFSAAIRVPSSQAEIIRELRKDRALDGFLSVVEKIENKPDRDKIKGGETIFGEVSEADLAEIEGSPKNYDLAGAKHTVDAPSIWHMYRSHCLDSFFGEKQVSVSFDDIRMIPDIVRNRDSVSVQKRQGKHMLVYTKQYGDLCYKYFAEISRVRDETKTRNAKFKTGWIEKTTGAGAISSPQQPQPTYGSRFPRTATILPLEERIKQNFSDEAKKIAEDAYRHDRAMLAPNGAISNLEPAQWVAVRLASFKDWFGDWENDPKNASKVLDENGEPLVVYHGTTAEFNSFDKRRIRKRQDGVRGFYFTPRRATSNYYAHGWSTPEDIGGLMQCFLCIKNPLVDVRGEKANNALEVAQDDGKLGDHDGIIAVEQEGDTQNAVEIVAFEPTQIKSATDKRGTFDANDADITYALRFSDSSTTSHGALSAGRMAFARTIAENVSKMLAEEIERFRSFDGKVRGSREKALVAIGAVYNMARSVSLLMPAGYRVNVHPYMKQLQVFAEMAATGDLDLTADMASQKVRDLDEMQGRMADWQGGVDALVQEYGNAKVNEVQAKILGKVGDSLTKMERDVAVAAIQKLFAQLAPKKGPKTGKLQRGVMKAEGYEEMEQIADAMRLDAEALDKKLAEIEAGIAKAEQNEDEAEILRLQGQHILYSTFGNLADMNLAGVMEAYDVSFGEYVAALARQLSGKAPMTYRRMAQSDWYHNRKAGHATMRRAQVMRSNDEKASWFEEGMEWAMQPMETIDAGLTANGLVPVWNAYYNQARKRGATEEDAEQEAWELTIDCANRGSQPIGWINRSKMAQERNAFARAATFMLSEDLNKAGLVTCRCVPGAAG